MNTHRFYFYYTNKTDDTEVEKAVRAVTEFVEASGKFNQD
jgi:hypothetical protein